MPAARVSGPQRDAVKTLRIVRRSQIEVIDEAASHEDAEAALAQIAGGADIEVAEAVIVAGGVGQVGAVEARPGVADEDANAVRLEPGADLDPALAATMVTAVVSLYVLTLPSAPSATLATDEALPAMVTFADARHIIDRRCAVCHSATPLDMTFGAAPAGVMRLEAAMLSK